MPQGVPEPSLTVLLSAWTAGDRSARDELMTLVYEQLSRIARSYMRRERPDHTLQATALVHEAYSRLTGGAVIEWQDRAHFFRTAAQAMRRILVDHARGLKTVRRDGGDRVALEETQLIAGSLDVDLLDLDRVLDDLARLDPRQAQIVELRFFSGATVAETARILDLSPATVKREWRTAKAWMRGELKHDSREG